MRKGYHDEVIGATTVRTWFAVKDNRPGWYWTIVGAPADVEPAGPFHGPRLALDDAATWLAQEA